MELNQRIVLQMPLHELWSNCRVASTKKIRSLSADDITDILRLGKTRFVIAKIGEYLKWTPLDESYGFWKSEVKMRVVNPEAEGFYLEHFPEDYCYIAEEWEADEGERIILLMMSH